MEYTQEIPLDTPQIINTFNNVRNRQAQQFGKVGVTPFDIKVGIAITNASLKAMQEVRDGTEGTYFKVVSAPTGAGKTTGSTAFAIANRRVDRNFTCAFVVQTIKQCNELYDALLLMCQTPEERADLVVWTSSHCIKTDKRQEEIKQGITIQKQFNRDNLKTAPIVIVTHKKWLHEDKEDLDTGVRFCSGKRRSLIYIDENPDLVEIIEQSPSDISRLKDAVSRINSEHPWVALLGSIYTKMDLVFLSDGSDFTATTLVEPLEVAHLSKEHMRNFFETATGLNDLIPIEQAKSTLRFLQAASQGYVFLTRRGAKSFVAYLPDYKPAAGYVLLDATADLSGIQRVLASTELIETPNVDYRNLTIKHIEPPKALKKVNKVLERHSNSEKYAAWIKEYVISSTAPTDKVLVVVHRKLIRTHELIPYHPDPMEPIDWDGRKISTIYWGNGIGSNLYKDAKHVFLFGEFFKPRRVIAGEVLGLSKTPAKSADFSQAQGRTLSGKFLKHSEGHLLRWTKQLACRGNVRNIDADGVCGVMTLHTSMDFKRLIGSLKELFPNAPSPVREVSEGIESLPPTEALSALLASPVTPERLSMNEVYKRTGVKSNRVATVLHGSLSPVRITYGWQVVTAKSLKLSGRNKYLVRNVNAIAA